MKNRKIAGAILLIAFTFGFNITGIAPILGVLNIRYAAHGTSGVQLLQTIPYALLMVGSLMIGWLTLHFSKKKLALAGLAIVGICGTAPFFTDSYMVLLASRILIGFGFGIISPINTAIVAEFFEPAERAKYLGLHVVGMGLGSMTGNLLGGALAGLGFRWFYLAYLAAFLAMAGVALLLPESPASERESGGHRKLNSGVWLVSAASFVHTLLITVYSTNVGIYVLEQITDNTAVTGVVTAVNAAFALIVGMLFPFISKRFGKHTLPVSILAAAAGYAAILFIPGMAGVYIGSACCGASLSCFMAQCSYLISVSTEPEAVAKASGIFSVIGGIGGLVSPVLLGSVAGKAFGGNTSAGQFLLGGIGMMILGVLTWILVLRKFPVSVKNNSAVIDAD